MSKMWIFKLQVVGNVKSSHQQHDHVNCLNSIDLSQWASVVASMKEMIFFFC
jgi:hypothetical protein